MGCGPETNTDCMCLILKHMYSLDHHCLNAYQWNSESFAITKVYRLSGISPLPFVTLLTLRWIWKSIGFHFIIHTWTYNNTLTPATYISCQNLRSQVGHDLCKQCGFVGAEHLPQYFFLFLLQIASDECKCDINVKPYHCITIVYLQIANNPSLLWIIALSVTMVK